MKISDIDSTVVHPSSSYPQVKPARSHQPGGPEKIQGESPSIPQSREAEFTSPSPDRIFYNKIVDANTKTNAIVRQIRDVDKTMDTIAKRVQKMKDALESITKSYPPYPQGSKERIAALRQFVGLRQQIDSLTMPPPPPEEGPGKLLGDPESYPNVGSWQISVGAGQDPITIRHQPLHSGSDGLDLPELPMEASDAMIHQAVSRIDQSQAKLQSRRAGFAEDANRVFAAI